MKKTSLIVMLLMLVSILGACGSKTDHSKDTSLETVLNNKKIILGLDKAFPPMGFENDNQEIVGFDIDVAKEVAKRMDIELVIQPINWKAKELELSTKNIDLIWNGMTYTEQRANEMSLSTPYMKNTQVVIVMNESSIESINDLAGKTVIIQNGSTASVALDNNKELKDSLKELILVDNNVQALLDLKTSGSDAVVMDEVVARYYLEKEGDTYRILEENLAEEEYVIGFRKGETALTDEINKQLKALKADGTLAKISEEWFGKDITTVK